MEGAPGAAGREEAAGPACPCLGSGGDQGRLRLPPARKPPVPLPASSGNKAPAPSPDAWPLPASPSLSPRQLRARAGQPWPQGGGRRGAGTLLPPRAQRTQRAGRGPRRCEAAHAVREAPPPGLALAGLRLLSTFAVAPFWRIRGVAAQGLFLQGSILPGLPAVRQSTELSSFVIGIPRSRFIGKIPLSRFTSTKFQIQVGIKSMGVWGRFREGCVEIRFLNLVLLHN